MASLAEVARSSTALDGHRLLHLSRLVASWGPLADLCFADLLLYAPVAGSDGDRFIVLGQVRPTTHQTVYRSDYVGTVVDELERPLVARAFRTGDMVEGEFELPVLHDRVRVLAIPIRWDDEVIGVCTRESMPSLRRQAGELERIYVDVFLRFAAMIAAGDFPFASDDVEGEEAPRVGDGAIVLDAEGRVEYASPNAVSALHRAGVHTNAEGMRLGELGLDEAAVRGAFAVGAPVTVELERGVEVSVVMRCLPLLSEGEVTGALVLLRDISELRRRDRLLVSMDASIRETHHRVKNNLQTISSLLRLQGRRVEAPEAKAAIEESVRRIRAIALVHEILSRAPGNEVPSADVLRPLVRMAEEGMVSPERPVRFSVEGQSEHLPPRIATPLAVVLNELLQNAADHAYPPDGPDEPTADRPGHVVVRLEEQGDDLIVQVEDDGVGLPPGFRVDDSSSLGLSIVRSLVTTQLGGTIELRPREPRGTVVELRVPLGVPAVP